VTEHQCFTVSTTAYMRNFDPEQGSEVFAVHYQKPPRKNDDGSTSFGLNFPTLIVSAYMAEPEKVAQRVADILNQHWESDLEEEKKLRAYGVLLDSAFQEVARAEDGLPDFVQVDEYATEVALKDGSDWRITVRRSTDG
jgi:hypothetical protein